MISTIKRSFKANVLPQGPKIINELELVKLLHGMCESRYQAYAHYPNAKNSQSKFVVIEQIRYQLSEAKTKLNYRQVLEECLKLERDFIAIAPHTTTKLYTTYINKLSDLMNACRNLLGRVKQ